MTTLPIQSPKKPTLYEFYYHKAMIYTKNLSSFWKKTKYIQAFLVWVIVWWHEAGAQMPTLCFTLTWTPLLFQKYFAIHDKDWLDALTKSTYPSFQFHNSISFPSLSCVRGNHGTWVLTLEQGKVKERGFQHWSTTSFLAHSPCLSCLCWLNGEVSENTEDSRCRITG